MLISGTTRTNDSSPRGIPVLPKSFQLVAVNGGTELLQMHDVSALQRMKSVESVQLLSSPGYSGKARRIDSSMSYDVNTPLSRVTTFDFS